MFSSKTKLLQLTVTLSACAFLLVPTILSVMAGVTATTLKAYHLVLPEMDLPVWELYADSFFYLSGLRLPASFVR